MKGKVNDGQLVTVEPLGETEPEVGDIVLCKVRGNHYLHLVKAKQGNPTRFQIGNNRGRINGWVGKNSVYGICTKVED
jgi:SOS-response transcriptional repressor LexA